MLQQGQRANKNLANVGGGLLSGNTLQGLQNYTQNYAGNAYQTAFDNYQKQRQNIYGNLSNAAGMGQTSLGQLGGTGASLGQTYGNVTTGLAASQAGAQTAQAVNNANLLSNLGNAALVSSIAGTPGTNLNMKLA
jgi:predicted trehalose synthase